MHKWTFNILNFCIFISALIILYFFNPTNQKVDASIDSQVIHDEMALPNMSANASKIVAAKRDFRNFGSFRLRAGDKRDILESLKPWDAYICKYSTEFGVDADLVRAVIYAESRGNPFVISRVGALGLMQIMPNTCVHLGITDPLDPNENIKAGVKYISMLFRSFGKSDETQILWAYNAGPGNLDLKKDIPFETKKFIMEVMAIKNFLKNSVNKA